jgi:hypothetical protein
MTHTGPTPTRRRLMSALRVTTLISFGLLAIWIGTRPQRAQAQRATNMAGHASFGADGSLHLPLGYRQWQHVGTRIKPDGKSVLDGSDISTPQVMDAYVEPAAFDQFKKTGVWREGARIVKEISLVKTGARCNSVTFVCATSFGAGIFEASYAGIGMMLRTQSASPMCRDIGAILASYAVRMAIRRRPRCDRMSNAPLVTKSWQPRATTCFPIHTSVCFPAIDRALVAWRNQG